MGAPRLVKIWRDGRGVHLDFQWRSSVKKGIAAVVGLVFLLSAGGLDDANAAKKKTHRKRSDFTAEQRAKMMEEARKICKKKYGAPSQVYHIDYYRWRVICTPPGY
jgi:hypothetical protein